MKPATPAPAEKRAAEKARLLASLPMDRPSKFNVAIAPSGDAPKCKTAELGFKTI